MDCLPHRVMLICLTLFSAVSIVTGQLITPTTSKHSIAPTAVLDNWYSNSVLSTDDAISASHPHVYPVTELSTSTAKDFTQEDIAIMPSKELELSASSYNIPINSITDDTLDIKHLESFLNTIDSTVHLADNLDSVHLLPSLTSISQESLTIILEASESVLLQTETSQNIIKSLSVEQTRYSISSLHPYEMPTVSLEKTSSVPSITVIVDNIGGMTTADDVLDTENWFATSTSASPICNDSFCQISLTSIIPTLPSDESELNIIQSADTYSSRILPANLSSSDSSDAPHVQTIASSSSVVSLIKTLQSQDFDDAIRQIASTTEILAQYQNNTLEVTTMGPIIGDSLSDIFTTPIDYSMTVQYSAELVSDQPPTPSDTSLAYHTIPVTRLASSQSNNSTQTELIAPFQTTMVDLDSTVISGVTLQPDSPTIMLHTSSVSVGLVSTTMKPTISIPLQLTEQIFLIKFDGNCQLLMGENVFLKEFKSELNTALSKLLMLDKKTISVSKTFCGSVYVIVTIYNALRNLTTEIDNNVSQHHLVLTLYSPNGTSIYVADSVREITNENDTFQDAGPAVREKPQLGKVLDEVDIIVIVVASCICGILIIIGIIICTRECYKRKRMQSFNLSDVTLSGLKMEDFTLTHIPRPRPVYKDPCTGLYTPAFLYAETSANISTPVFGSKDAYRKNPDNANLGDSSSRNGSFVNQNHHMHQGSDNDEAKSSLLGPQSNVNVSTHFPSTHLNKHNTTCYKNTQTEGVIDWEENKLENCNTVTQKQLLSKKHSLGLHGTVNPVYRPDDDDDDDILNDYDFTSPDVVKLTF